MRQLQVMNLIRDARATFLRGGTPKAILYAIETFANAEGWSWPSLETLGAAAGVSERATWPQIARLEANGVLEVVRGTQQHSNRYRIRTEALSALRAEGRSVLRTEAPPVPKHGQDGSPRTPERKIASSRTEATSDEGSQEGSQVKEPNLVAVATNEVLKLEVVEPKPKTDHQRVIEAYAEGYGERTGGKTPRGIGERGGKAVKDLIASYGVDEALAIVRRGTREWTKGVPLLTQIAQYADTFRGPPSAQPRVGGQPEWPSGRAWAEGGTT